MPRPRGTRIGSGGALAWLCTDNPKLCGWTLSAADSIPAAMTDKQAGQTSADRAARKAAALRANLNRRKAQARARKEPGDGETGPEPGHGTRTSDRRDGEAPTET